ncbi:hypothetical protein J6590_092371, partial [Homalodisca vitripennis]
LVLCLKSDSRGICSPHTSEEIHESSSTMIFDIRDKWATKRIYLVFPSDHPELSIGRGVFNV